MDESTCRKCGGTMSVVSIKGLCPACFALDGLVSNTNGRAARRRNEWQPPTAEMIATRFPETDQIQLVGRGGMGAVFRARQKHLDRVVALKILPPQLLEDSTFSERFAREAQALARLNHPNIVTIHDFGKREDLYYFIMEYVDGLTLRQLLARGRVPADQAVAIVPQICDALQYAHEQGIVHRDIKPENILVNRRGQVKIADFGLAKLIGWESDAAPMAATTSVVGTPLYMAPEQIESPGSVDHRADLYSLGVVMYELLTGELPDGEFQPLARKMHIDVKLDELVARALQPEPARRFASAVEFRTHLETIALTPSEVVLPSPKPIETSETVDLAGTEQPPSGSRKSGRRSDVERQLFRRVRSSVVVPARGIKYVAVANIAFLVVTTIPALLSYVSAAPDKVIDSPLGLHLTLPWWATGTFMYTVLSLAMNAFVVAGANRLRELRSYGWALASAILCLFSAPGNVVGAVFGVWAIIILSRSETRQVFGVQAAKSPAPDIHQQGLIAWMPLVRVIDGERRPDLVNYTILSSSVWLLSYAAVSLLLLGRPAEWGYALLLLLPALAVAQSLHRRQRRFSPEELDRGNALARRPMRVMTRAMLLGSMLLLQSTVAQSLAVRDLAQQRSSTRPTTGKSLPDKLHITVPKI